jgi:hypothetical protein
MNAPPKLIVEFFLTDDERTSPVWESVRGHLERMLAKKRIENDNSELTDVETATLRGHIDCLKAFIALGRKPPQMTAPAARPSPRPDLGARYG